MALTGDGYARLLLHSDDPATTERAIAALVTP